MNDILELAARIAGEFQPDRIVLFGSHAYGRPTPDSDVDLMVVLAHEDKNWQVATRIRGRVRPKFPLDLLVRSPRQIRDRTAMGDPFLKEIISRGRILYEADHPGMDRQG